MFFLPFGLRKQEKKKSNLKRYNDMLHGGYELRSRVMHPCP